MLRNDMAHPREKIDLGPVAGDIKPEDELPIRRVTLGFDEATFLEVARFADEIRRDGQAAIDRYYDNSAKVTALAAAVPNFAKDVSRSGSRLLRAALQRHAGLRNTTSRSRRWPASSGFRDAGCGFDWRPV